MGDTRLRARISQDTEERKALVELLRPLLGASLSAEKPEACLTTREVALLLRVSPATVRRWADTGKLQTYRSLGGHRLFPLSTVRRALDRFTMPDCKSRI